MTTSDEEDARPVGVFDLLCLLVFVVMKLLAFSSRVVGLLFIYSLGILLGLLGVGVAEEAPPEEGLEAPMESGDPTQAPTTF